MAGRVAPQPASLGGRRRDTVTQSEGGGWGRARRVGGAPQLPQHALGIVHCPRACTRGLLLIDYAGLYPALLGRPTGMVGACIQAGPADSAARALWTSTCIAVSHIIQTCTGLGTGLAWWGLSHCGRCIAAFRLGLPARHYTAGRTVRQGPGPGHAPAVMGTPSTTRLLLSGDGEE